MVLKSRALFDKFSPLIKDYGPKMVKQVGAVYCFEIREKKGGEPTLFTVDLKNGQGQYAVGAIKGVKPDCTFVMLDDDFMDLSNGKLKGQDAFMKGKMKIKGNMAAAMKMKPEMFPKEIPKPKM